jgi:hypothetical protein
MREERRFLTNNREFAKVKINEASEGKLAESGRL